MFLYHPPKAMCFGHAFRARDPVEAKEKIEAFLDRYFERVEPDQQDGTTITFKVHWKSSALPTVEWPDQFLKPENQHLRLIMFMLMGDRIIFPLGIVFPISLIDAASYEFLATFNANAPFRMTAKHFSVVVPIGKQGKYRARKPDSEITARLNEVILSPGRAV